MGCGGSKPEQRGAGLGPSPKEVEDDRNRALMQRLSEKNVVQMLGMVCKGAGDRKMSIGSSTDQGETSFSDKAVEKLGDQLDPEYSGLGYTCRKGMMPGAPNQDSWTILRLDGDRHNCSIYCVMDGRGPRGHDVSQFVKENLIKLIVKDRRFMTDQMPAMLKDCFEKMQSLIASADRLRMLSAQMSGTTCTLAVHDHVSHKRRTSRTAPRCSGDVRGGARGRPRSS
jgi:hypothetical protein